MVLKSKSSSGVPHSGESCFLFSFLLPSFFLPSFYLLVFSFKFSLVNYQFQHFFFVFCFVLKFIVFFSFLTIFLLFLLFNFFLILQTVLDTADPSNPFISKQALDTMHFYQAVSSLLPKASQHHFFILCKSFIIVELRCLSIMGVCLYKCPVSGPGTVCTHLFSARVGVQFGQMMWFGLRTHLLLGSGVLVCASWRTLQGEHRSLCCLCSGAWPWWKHHICVTRHCDPWEDIQIGCLLSILSPQNIKWRLPTNLEWKGIISQFLKKKLLNNSGNVCFQDVFLGYFLTVGRDRHPFSCHRTENFNSYLISNILN